MARRTNAEGLIHCNACGEDYSATYKRCPFCGEKLDVRPVDDEDFDDGFVFDGQALFDEPRTESSAPRSSGGKRLAARPSSGSRSHSKSRGHTAPPPMKPSRLITYILSLVIIVAALVIVFGVIYPKLHKNPNPSPPPSGSQSGEPSPSIDPTGEPTSEPTDGPTDPPVSSPDSLTLSKSDFTLQAGEKWTIKAEVSPADWDGTVVWTSSDENYATVSADGTVTNVNGDTRLHRVIITATAGTLSQECIVYCRGTDATSGAPDVTVSPSGSADPDPSSTLPAIGEGVAPGKDGVIANAGGGLRVRSGPGTSYDILASLVNGNKISILEDAGDGWFKISFAGEGGKATTGYIMGAYIQVK